ncbi:MAG: putative Ig domain-containing protein, partial [Candidatus Poseidoniaceae archaeon]
SNGTIYGTPTQLWSKTAYMVWANNSGGSSVAYLNITVVDELPTIAYSPTDITLTNNTVSTDLPLVPTITGPGEITSWAINASLPAGLTFETSNGTIWGTPTELWNTTAYTVWANNSGGSSVAYLNITVIDQLPTSVTYTPENLTLTRGEVSSDLPLVPALTGPGDITTWGINASLPTGLSFGTNNGTIWGVPQVNMTTTEYTVWANNSGGSVSTTLNITVLEPIVVLDYNPENLTLVRSIAMTDLHPIVTGGSVETWEIHPSIPAGLNFADGVLSGTPTVNMTLTMFTIYANTTGGSASHTINLTILEPGVILEYNPENQTMTRGVAMVTMTPTVTNGTAETWSIDPLLPSGLSFNNGVISGTPTVNMTRTMFTVWANTTGGASFHTINLTILEPIVGLDYNPENLTLTRGVAMTDLHPIVTGGNVSEWGISPAPLSGLNFADGMLSGTPGINQTTPIMYTIYANTTGGSITHTINITVLEPVVDLFYNPENQTFIRTEQTIAWMPTVSGGIPETWAIEPALPNGLVFDNGTISGSPTVNLTTTQYTVWANNSGGSASTSINITINEPAPDIEYVPSDLVLTRGTAMTTLQPNVTGGLIETWEIEPAIPNGLSFVDGVISGTPTAIQNQTQYVVWANNSGGALMAYLNITILDIVPEIAYTPENMTLTNDTSVVDWLPVNIGGPALTWSISPALSEGLEFNETTGHITGTPTEVMDVRTYMVTATNTGGSASTQINITVLDQVPMVAYVPDDVVLLNNSTVLTMEAISTGGVVTEWSILPEPSPGLLFDTTNGTLSGVATQVQNRTMYVITASNDVGSITVFVNITVEDLFYNMSLGPLYLLNNSEMVALEPELTINGSTFEIEP